MSIIYRKAELNDIPKLNPLLAQLSDAMADPQKMAEKMEKIAKNEDLPMVSSLRRWQSVLCF